MCGKVGQAGFIKSSAWDPLVPWHVQAAWPWHEFLTLLCTTVSKTSLVFICVIQVLKHNYVASASQCFKDHLEN